MYLNKKGDNEMFLQCINNDCKSKKIKRNNYTVTKNKLIAAQKNKGKGK